MINSGGEQRNLLAVYYLFYAISELAGGAFIEFPFDFLPSFFLARVYPPMGKSRIRARARAREREREREGERELQCIFLRCIPPFSLRLINRLIKSDELRFKLRASRSSSEPLIFRSSVRQLSSGVAFAFAYNSSQLSRWLSCAAALIRDGIAVR